MPKYEVQVPFVGYFTQVVEAQDAESAEDFVFQAFSKLLETYENLLISKGITIDEEEFGCVDAYCKTHVKEVKEI